LVVFFGSAQVSTAASRDPWIEGAKKEGEVILYASMNLEEANAMISRFEQKYPFVKVKLNRTDSEKLLTKILAEARAKKSFADVIQTLGFAMHTLKKSQHLGYYLGSENGNYPKEFKKRDTGLRFIRTLMSSPTIPDWSARRTSRAGMKTSCIRCGRGR